MLTSTRGCAEPMLPFCRLKAKVTLEGKKLTFKKLKTFLNFNMYMNISETRKIVCLKLKMSMKSQLEYAGQVSQLCIAF